MNLENFNPHQKVELIKMLMHNQFEFKWFYDADELQVKLIHQKEWDWGTTSFLRLIKDILTLHGYNCSLKEIVKIFKDDELIHNIPPAVTFVEDLRDYVPNYPHQKDETKS
jgi:hypothetical protein